MLKKKLHQVYFSDRSECLIIYFSNKSWWLRYDMSKFPSNLADITHKK